MIDLYSSATPNGRKITILLEELGIDYNPININLNKKEQFSENFSSISPTNKIPVIYDKENNQIIIVYIFIIDIKPDLLTNDNFWISC